MSDILIARQPIFDRRANITGYELLYRNGDNNRAEFSDSDTATSQVILNAFAEFGLEGIVGSQKAYINLTRNFILDHYPIPFSPEQVVLEVPENILVDDELIGALKGLSERGYQIALDDVVNPCSVDSLLGVANIVKVDLILTDRDALAKSIACLRKYQIRLLAEKVETQADFDECLSLGFDYFQGYFLCRPEMVKGHAVPTSRLVVMQTLGRLHNPKVEFQELENVVAQDVTLGYKLLRLVNSAYYGIPTKVKSIRQAMSLLGIQKLRGWLTLFLLSGLGEKPRALTTFAMIRGKMCERLALAMGEQNSETHFLVGLFSVLDALMELPMDQALTTLPLSEDVTAALMRYEGKLGQVLKCSLAYEKGDWTIVEAFPLNRSQIRDAYLDALRWTSVVGNELALG